MNIDFQCTKCGDCCKNLWLSLSFDEAIRWLIDGNSVQVLCEAIPWPSEPPSSNRYAEYKRERSFPAVSGTLPIRVQVTLAAPLGERCPNLLPNNLCGIYEQRPLVCRIYPAEINPHLDFSPERRLCPPEAWQVGGAPLIRNADYVDGELRSLIQTRQNHLLNNVPFQEALCKALEIHVAAMVNEGYVAHSLDNAKLLAALREIGEQSTSLTQDWTFISDRIETVEMIRLCDAKSFPASEYPSSAFKYLSLLAK